MIITAQSIVDDYLHLLRERFYYDEKSFYQQRRLLIQAITYPTNGSINAAFSSPNRTIERDPGRRHFWHREARRISAITTKPKVLQAKTTLSMAEILKGVKVSETSDSTSASELPAQLCLYKHGVRVADMV